jgi:hypothetical protein
MLCAWVLIVVLLYTHPIVNAAASLLGGLTTVINSAGVLQGGGMDTANLDNFKYNFGKCNILCPNHNAMEWWILIQ